MERNGNVDHTVDYVLGESTEAAIQRKRKVASRIITTRHSGVVSTQIYASRRGRKGLRPVGIEGWVLGLICDNRADTRLLCRHRAAARLVMTLYSRPAKRGWVARARQAGSRGTRLPLSNLHPHLFFEERYHAPVPRHPQQVKVLSLGKPNIRWACEECGRDRKRLVHSRICQTSYQS